MNARPSRRELLTIFVLGAGTVGAASCSSFISGVGTVVSAAGDVAAAITDISAFVNGVTGALATIEGIFTIPPAVLTTIDNGITTLQGIISAASAAATAGTSAAGPLGGAEAAINSVINSLLSLTGVPALVQTIVADIEIAIDTLLPEILAAAGIATPSAVTVHRWTVLKPAANGLSRKQALALLNSLAAK